MWLKFQPDCWPLLTDYAPGGERGIVLIFIQSYIISQYLSHMFWNIEPLFLIKMSNKLANYKIVYNLVWHISTDKLLLLYFKIAK